MSMEKLLPIASFAMALGGLVRLFLPPDRTKEAVLATVISFLMLLSGFAWYQSSRHAQRVKTVSQGSGRYWGRTSKPSISSTRPCITWKPPSSMKRSMS